MLLKQKNYTMSIHNQTTYSQDTKLRMQHDFRIHNEKNYWKMDSNNR